MRMSDVSCVVEYAGSSGAICDLLEALRHLWNGFVHRGLCAVFHQQHSRPVSAVLQTLLERVGRCRVEINAF